MKTKKLVSGIALLSLSVLLLTACGGNDSDTKDTSTKESSAKVDSSEKAPERVAGGELKDGTYQLEEKNADEHGWKAKFSMTVESGKITKSEFDYINDKEEKKSEDKEYDKSMSEKVKTGPATFIPELNESLVSAQSADGVDVVTGATHSSLTFKNYAQQLIQAAQAGNTETIEINNGADLQDGTYTLEEKNESNGYRTVFSIVVKDGKLAESKYDNINADGESKVDNAEYNEKMKEQTGTGPSDFIPALNESLVAAGNAGDVEVVTGATHSSHTFQMYAAQLINAAENGNTETILVDNIVTK